MPSLHEEPHRPNEDVQVPHVHSAADEVSPAAALDLHRVRAATLMSVTTKSARLE